MQKIKVRKDVAEQVKSKLQASKTIEKANFYPHQKHGWFGFKLAPDMGASGGGNTNTSEEDDYTEMECTVNEKNKKVTKKLKVRNDIAKLINDGKVFYKFPRLTSKTQKRNFAADKLCDVIKETEIEEPDKEITNADTYLRVQLQKVQNLFAEKNRGKCKALNNRKVKVEYKTVAKHLTDKINEEEKRKRAKAVRFIPEIIEDKGYKVGSELVESPKGYAALRYDIVGKCEIDGNENWVSIILVDKPDNLLHLTIFTEEIQKSFRHDTSVGIIDDSYTGLASQESISKSSFVYGIDSLSMPITLGKVVKTTDYEGSEHSYNPTKSNISQRNNLSSKKVIKNLTPDYNGEDRFHKSFDIQITDITENNKQQKLEQLSKALNAIADKKPFMIKHISADNSTRYENLTVRLMDFDRSKIEKAVHKVALSLDADVLASSKGESFVYESQKEITENFYKKVTDSARAVYNFVISYFDLPDIRIISKAGELKHKGKILYNPETGLPIKESEWKKFIVELEKFLNRNYSGVGEKIVLSAESLGIILDRLSKTNSLEAIRKMPLSTLKAKRYDVDWISDSIQNMKDQFGDVISRERQARIQIAMDSAAQRVTRVKDDIRNNIQQIIIDGIRDKQSKSVVAQNLFDKCASLNRDMQRIADSEVQMAANSAYCKEEVYNSKPDEKVYFKRFEMMDDNTCKQCKKLNGTIVLWSDVPLPDEHIRDPYAKYAIWEGKNEGSCPVGIVHPYCYSDDTEVMTNNGWKLFKDVEKNDKIMSINPETKEIDFVPYVQKIQYEYNGDMIHFPGRNFDMLVTPDHNMLYLAGNGHGERQLKGIKASELIKNTAFALPRAMGEWKHIDTKTVKFGDLTISKAQYFRLWAWYLAEGSGRLRDGHYEVKLAQKEPIKIYNDLPELQSILHINSDCVCLHGDYARYFECMFGIYADKKFIPPFIKNSSVENIREFLDAFVMADGTRLTNHKCSSDKAYSEFRNEQVLRTSSKKMADDLCEMIVKAGWMPSEYVVHEKGKINHFKNGDYVLNTDCHNITICKSKTRTYYPDKKGHKPMHKPAYEKYNGMVYDVELEKWHFLLVRRNGKCGWSGNCRGSWIRYYPDLDKN